MLEDLFERVLRKPLPTSDRELELFWQAITHDSCVTDDSHYDRLEFLGDAILKFVVNTHLYQRFPEYNSGLLTKMSAHLLSDKVLQELATRWNLPARVGKQIEANAVLADVAEAIFGAHYICYGYESTRDFIFEFYGSQLREASLEDVAKNYKAMLQEHTQAIGRGLPEYVVTSSSGNPQKPWFEVEVRLGVNVLGRGSGPSKKEAGQHAAKDSLEKLT